MFFHVFSDFSEELLGRFFLEPLIYSSPVRVSDSNATAIIEGTFPSRCPFSFSLLRTVLHVESEAGCFRSGLPINFDRSRPCKKEKDRRKMKLNIKSKRKQEPKRKIKIVKRLNTRVNRNRRREEGK